MTNINTFFQKLDSLNIKIWVDDNQLYYDAPEKVMSESILEEMSNRKDEIINELILIRKNNILSNSDSNNDSYPLSFNQEQLWFFSELLPNSALYNIPGAVLIRGNINIDRLEKSINEVIKRHEALRSYLQIIDGRPMQKISNEIYVSLPINDLRHLPLNEAKNTAFNIAKTDATTPVCLFSPPLFRIKLFIIDNNEYILQVTIHHIISDGWSMGIFIRDLMEMYECLYKSENNYHKTVSQYKDFSIWQRKNYNDGLFDKHIEFWKDNLSSAPFTIDLPFDINRPSNNGFAGNVKSIKIENELFNKLKKFSSIENSSLFHVVLAAFQILIYRYTSQEDFVLGFLSANRNQLTKDTIGYFVNSLPMRVCITPSKSFKNVLLQAKNSLIHCLENQDLPFEKIVDALKVERKLNYNPIFQVLVANEYKEVIKSSYLDIEFEYFLVDHEKSKFDLTLFIAEDRDNLCLSLEYNTAMFTNIFIENMLDDFVTLIDSIIVNPDINISKLQILSESKYNMLVYDWNKTTYHFPLEKKLHELFEEQVLCTPDSVAVSFSSGNKESILTYSELNYKANQLARYLLSIGSVNNTLIGVYMERSIEMVVSFLGILKAGAAYVPLDPEYPFNRLNFMIEDAQISMLLTSKHLCEETEISCKNNICIDVLFEKLSSIDGENFSNDVSPEDIAYVIYTSGSTGIPKGVMNTHKGICNRLHWMQKKFKLNSDDRVLQKTPFSFDVSVWEFFWPLITGSRLVLAKPGGHKDSQYLSNVICEQGITTVHFVPSMLQVFLKETKVDICNNYLKRVICSGEVLSSELQQRFFEKLTVRLYNLYGPTEAAIDVTYWECKSDSNHKNIPIGKPISNTQIYILDTDLQPVPIGVAGEIYIGGFNVARGYWNNQQLTEERFINNPFDVNNTKMYRTGDKAKFLADGNIDFLGRIDYQVKIRGNRIELGEIETILKQYQCIEDAVVLVRTDISDLTVLVAYLVMNKKNYTINELDKYLRDQLPEYMIPAKYVMLEKIPLSVNGKIDRALLPAPRDDRPLIETSYIEPETEQEKLLTKIWGDVLGIKTIGIHDKFFDLGGDSIRSIQVVYLAREKGFHFVLQDIFRYRTIHELAKLGWDNSNSQSSIIKKYTSISENSIQIISDGIEDAYPLSMLQIGLVYHSSFSSSYSSYITSYNITAVFNPILLQKAIDKVIAINPMLRTSFDFNNFDQPMQIIHKNINAVLHTINLLHLSEEQQNEEINKWIDAEKSKRFIWEEAPLFRFFAHMLDEKHFRFSIVEPILDGWSVAILSSEIFNVYQGLLVGELIILNEKYCCYKDFINLEEVALNSVDCRQFWSNKLLDSVKSNILRWPSKDKTSEIDKEYLVRKKIRIPKIISDELKLVAESLSVPLKSVLFAAYIRLIHLMSGQEDIITGLLMNGRLESRDGDKIVGLFLNAVPFRHVNKSETWYDLIYEVYDAETEILPFRRYPLAQIQLEQGGTLFDTVFNFVHFYPYSNFDDVTFKIEKVQANDQTYFPLTVQFSVDWETSDIKLSLDYNTAEFCSNQINNIADYLIEILSNIGKTPNKNYLNQQLLTSKDHKLLNAFNDTNKDMFYDQCFEHLFRAQVVKTPNHIAVEDSIGKLTYKEINFKANKIARALIKIGVRPGDIVSVLARRNVDYLAIILGIFKARGVYLPIHPEWPHLRVKQIFQQSKSNLVITTENYVSFLENVSSSLNADFCPSIISLSEIEKQNDEIYENLDSEYYLSDLSYVIYTSGSTGVPKGAMISHLGMLNHLYAKIEDLNLDETSVVAQTASQCFDISIWQLLSPLLVGGRVYIVENEIFQDPNQLFNIVLKENINVLEIVPTYFKIIIDELHAKRIRSALIKPLKWMLLTGEALPSKLCNLWINLFPNIKVMNAYGPTECSDDVTHYIVSGIIDDIIPIVPIGKPIRNMKLYILDKDLNVLPIGVQGEIYVEGIGVGKGYLNNKELTDSSFVNNLFNKDISPKLYKTGDLGRFLPDGNIEFLGRIDHQVKIRGFRIEIDEIEKVLCDFKSIKNAAVICDDYYEKKELIAYIVLNEKFDVDLNEIRRHLQLHLPEYMVPLIIMPIEYIPTNQNGKTDKKLLPKPDYLLMKNINTFVAPRNQFEIELATIWAEVLKIKHIGVFDNFFDLGGHSLQAIQIVSKIAGLINRDISVNFLLQHPTISQFAETIDNYNSENSFIGESKVVKPLTETRLLNLQLENRSLLKLYIASKIEKVDAVALGYLPSSLIKGTGLTRDEIIDEWMDNLPEIRRIFTTSMGRIAHIVLPIFEHDIYNLQDRLIDKISDAIDIAITMKAQTVSLTGLLPSATNYGYDVLRTTKKKPIKITTGHTTTVAAVVLSIEKTLNMLDRNIVYEKVGYLGLGSIGISSLRLMLKVLQHPHEITLCDIYGKTNQLEELKNEIIISYGFQGKVHIKTSYAQVPTDFYDSTLIVGATSVENILRVEDIKPGTIIVDDSAPHCFDTEQAITRFEKTKDIIFTEGGILRTPNIISELRYLPNPVNNKNPFAHLTQYRNSDYEIMGCILSSVLCSTMEEVNPIIGMPSINEIMTQFLLLKQLGYKGSELCCKDYSLTKENVSDFIKAYSNKNGFRMLSKKIN
jgi:amino acid adenylation domain-containing protein